MSVIIAKSEHLALLGDLTKVFLAYLAIFYLVILIINPDILIIVEFTVLNCFLASLIATCLTYTNIPPAFDEDQSELLKEIVVVA